MVCVMQSNSLGQNWHITESSIPFLNADKEFLKFLKQCFFNKIQEENVEKYKIETEIQFDILKINLENICLI